MLLSKENQEYFTEVFLALPEILRNNILNMSVKLDYGGSKASGVILRVDNINKSTIILTAKHSLYVWEKKERAPVLSIEELKKLAEKIRGSLRIFYDNSAFCKGKTEVFPAHSAGVDSITLQGHSYDPESAWCYDIMLLESKDANLFEFASKIFSKKQYFNYDWPELKRIKPFVTNPKMYLNKGSLYFFQTGFGDITETLGEGTKAKIYPYKKESLGGYFQVRRLWEEIDADHTTSIYLKNEKSVSYEMYGAIMMKAGTDNSTAPGDSGGPLFAVRYDKSSTPIELYIIGITLGADHVTSEGKKLDKDKLRVNNVATSLEEFYSQIE